MWWRQGNKQSRQCGEAQDKLLYVLNHCFQHIGGWMGRHNVILDRVARAQGTLVRVNQRGPGVDGNLRPDHVVVSEPDRRIYNVDVAITFENRYEVEAWRLKFKK